MITRLRINVQSNSLIAKPPHARTTFCTPIYNFSTPSAELFLYLSRNDEIIIYTANVGGCANNNYTNRYATGSKSLISIKGKISHYPAIDGGVTWKPVMWNVYNGAFPNSSTANHLSNYMLLFDMHSLPLCLWSYTVFVFLSYCGELPSLDDYVWLHNNLLAGGKRWIHESWHFTFFCFVKLINATQLTCKPSCLTHAVVSSTELKAPRVWCT